MKSVKKKDTSPFIKDASVPVQKKPFIGMTYMQILNNNYGLKKLAESELSSHTAYKTLYAFLKEASKANDIHRRLNPDSRVQHYMSFADMFSEVSSKGLNCEDFCQQFMNSQYAQDLEKISLKSQLPSGATMLNDFLSNSMVTSGGQSIGIEAIRWVGYMYAYWHIATGESYKEIYAQANLERMVTNYLGMHCLQEDAVIANLKQIYKDSKSSGGTLSELTQLSSKEESHETEN